MVVAVRTLLWPARARGGGRLLAAFGFGLFHGLGFAGGLLDLMHAMPTETVLLALLGFSLGIEAGNQLVLLPLFGALRLLRGGGRGAARRAGPSGAVRRIGSAGIAVAGACYLVAALAGGA